MKRTSDYIFVYGTLRGDSPTGAHKEYLRNSDFVTNAKIRGKLFLIDYYPGLVQASEGEENESIENAQRWVIGEIYVLQNEKQLHQLDIYEGCAPQSPQPHEYKRELVTVRLPNNESMEAWTYIYMGDITSLPVIQSGDFLRQLHEDVEYSS